MGAIDLIAAERQRQIDQEGYSQEHDDNHTDGSLAQAAACYALGNSRITNLNGDKTDLWPTSWDAPGNSILGKSRQRQLEIAGALIAAELDRLLRLDEKLDWKRAGEHLEDVTKAYTDLIGQPGTDPVPAISMVIQPLAQRFNRGERTQELFDQIMALE